MPRLNDFGFLGGVGCVPSLVEYLPRQ